MPQVFLNYKIKSTKALSDFYLVGYFNGYAITFFYVYAFNLHLAYKIRSILAVFVVAFMIYQRFKYDGVHKHKKIRRLYVSDFAVLFVLTPFVFSFPKIAGHIAGWALVIVWSLYQLPQILKNHRQKSVEGFSFILVSLIGIGNIIELFIAYFLNYPIQTYFIAVRGIIIYLIFMFQFGLYGKRSFFLKRKTVTLNVSSEKSKLIQE